jgi:hypothetical protein
MSEEKKEMSEVNLNKVCRDFMKGKCERQNCRFIHDTKLCKRFHENWVRNGRATCKYGEHCRKKHYVTVTQINNNEQNTMNWVGNNNNNNKTYKQQERVSNYRNQNDKPQRQHHFTKKDNTSTKKPRNTESWEPPHPPYDMRVQIETSNDKLSCELRPYDVLFAKSVFFDYKKGEIHDKLVSEIEKCGELKDDLLKLWHGSEERGIKGTHHIANDRTNWKKECPTFELVINRLVEFFSVKPAATRFNWYKTHEEYKSFHFDSAYVNPEKAKTQNITIAVSFGQTRDIVFENAKSKQRVCIEQGDNDVYVFMNEINSTWRHGVSKGVHQDNSSRVSIVIWGWIDGVSS